MPGEAPELILYLISDEHRWSAMEHTGDPNLLTPNLGRMASEGFSFNRAYANCPICTPSRGTIFSGRHAHSGPVQGFFDVYKATSPSIATELKRAGYHTAYLGKWHCGIIRDQVPIGYPARDNLFLASPHATRTPEYHRGGFEDWFAFEYNNAPFESVAYRGDAHEPERLNGYQTDALTDAAVSYLNDYSEESPLFLVLSVEPPHFPLEVPERYLRWSPEDLVVDEQFQDSMELREKLAAYLGMIENLDENIGRLFEAVSKHPRFSENTLTIYLSDHGEYLGNRGAYERKEYPHDDSVRIPSIFHWPGRITPRQDESYEVMFSLLDLAPTTLGLVGAKIPDFFQGVDFSPFLRGDPFQPPESVLIEMVGNPRWSLDFLDWRGIVTDQWKYVFYETGAEELYNLAGDPQETTNLVDSHGEQKEMMKTLLLRELERTREPYFDVLINHGVPINRVTHDIRWSSQGALAPGYRDGSVHASGSEKRRSI